MDNGYLFHFRLFHLFIHYNYNIVDVLRNIMLMLSMFLSIIIVQSISVNEKIPYTGGSKYAYSRSTLVGISSFGVLLNGFSLFILLTDENVFRIQLYPYILYLNFIDLIFSISELSYSAINIHFNKVYGGDLECQIMAVVSVTLFIWSVLILVLISYAMDRMLSDGKPLLKSRVIFLMILSPIYSVIVAVLSIYLPLGGYFLQPSATWCMAQYHSPLTFSIILGLGIILPMNIMINCLYKVYITVTKSQQILATQGLGNIQAKMQYVEMSKKLFIFVLNVSISTLPLLICALWELITNKYPPAVLDTIAGLIVTTNPCLLNPISFILLNYEMKNSFIRKFQFIISFFINKKKVFPNNNIIQNKAISIYADSSSPLQ